MIGSLTQKKWGLYGTYRLQYDTPKYEIYWYPYFFSNGIILTFIIKAKPTIHIRHPQELQSRLVLPIFATNRQII
jgi:hypothetical protein